MNRETVTKEMDEQKSLETSIPDIYVNSLNHKLQNIHETTDFQLRFIGLDLDYYKQRIPPEQLRLLMEIVGIYPAPENFNPEETFYPEDL